MSRDIDEQTAWIHAEAANLVTDDLVFLASSLRCLIAESTRLLEMVRAEIEKQRKPLGIRNNHPDTTAAAQCPS